jgi:NADH-quinone oxidoreductase subunit M
LGIILGAAYMLWAFQRVMFGELDKPENTRITDANGREVAYMIPLVILMIWIGIYPKPYLRTMEASVSYWLNQVQQRASIQRDAAVSPPLPSVAQRQKSPAVGESSKED